MKIVENLKLVERNPPTSQKITRENCKQIFKLLIFFIYCVLVLFFKKGSTSQNRMYNNITSYAVCSVA